MGKQRYYRRDEVIACSQTTCLVKDCPNYSKVYTKFSFYFPSCSNNPNRNKENDSSRNAISFKNVRI